MRSQFFRVPVVARAAVASSVAACVLAVTMDIYGVAKASPDAGAPTVAQQVMQKAIDKLQRNPDWDRIEIAMADGRWHLLRLVYREFPAGANEVESDTKTIVAAVVSEMIASGEDPLRERPVIGVMAMGPAQEKAGKAQLEIYAHAHYNEFNGQVQFVPEKLLSR